MNMYAQTNILNLNESVILITNTETNIALNASAGSTRWIYLKLIILAFAAEIN
jgi:hypothetical protein